MKINDPKMKSSVGNLTSITSGIYEKIHPLGEAYQLQARDFDEYREIKKGLNPNIFLTPNVEKHILNEGDVLVVAKGNEFFAAVYRAVFAPAVASSVFLVLRNLDRDRAHPEYLAWFINQPFTQALLKNSAKGTSLPTINKQLLASLEIPLPSLEVQRILVNFQKLRQREQQLTLKIASAREALIDQKLFNLINE